MQLPISFERYFTSEQDYGLAWGRFIKRMMDIVFCLVVVLLLFPIAIPLISVCILFDSGWPVFFVQKRVGYRQREFYCLKFRTLMKGQDGHVPCRPTRVGTLLRNSGLDELPQLFNVLIGDMSVVGPRPYSLQDHKRFREQVAHFDLRYQARPGITGLAQAEGYKGQIHSEREINERTALDLMYLNQNTIWGDLKIMWRSVIFLIVELFKTLWKR